MDAVIVCLCIASWPLVFWAGYRFRKRTDPLVVPQHDDIPHIEIDGQMVPHPTIVARREKAARLAKEANGA